jgi:pimeloyl-ACP methyl ester carboxylesterase
VEVPVIPQVRSLFWKSPQPTPRTQQFLRRYDLVTAQRRDPRSPIRTLLENPGQETGADQAYVLSELAFLAAYDLEAKGNSNAALEYYGLSVAKAYEYLLADDLADARNPYDPRFRQASDLYNGALENALRIVKKRQQLKPGTVIQLGSETLDLEIHLDCHGPWKAEDIAELKFVSDYELQGLKNHYRTYGLGVPLVAVLNREAASGPAQRYYSPGVSFPATAFLRVQPVAGSAEGGRGRYVGRLEIYDPLRSTDITIQDRLIPLETDLSTPLAYTLNDPSFKRANNAIKGLLNLEESQKNQGLYLLEPYDPDKIPVLMIHGLYSSLNTWMEMFNDLRGTPEIRDHYQFWFYQYPTGQPFLLTAAQLRRELKDARSALEPSGEPSPLDEMVFVGHSMGGLIARLQTLESEDRFEPLAADIPGGLLLAQHEGTEQSLRHLFRFHPNPSVQRVVTIASPHHGSAFANGATQWLARRLIRLPDVLLIPRDALLQAKDGQEHPSRDSWAMQTSLDALSPASPILEAMQEAPAAEWVRYHNIVGRIAEQGILSKVAKDSDGVVSLASAHLDAAESELVVECDHVNIHRHPRTILEVQRILLQHLREQSSQVVPAGGR